MTRDIIVEIAKKENICLKEQNISEAALFNAQEIWLTSSTKEILPVTKLNNKIVGNGKPGAHWQQMMNAFQRYIKAIGQTRAIR